MYILVDRVENDKITFSVIAADIKCLWVKDDPGYLPNVLLRPLRQKIPFCTEIPINTKIIKISWNQAEKCITSKIIGFVFFWHTLKTSNNKTYHQYHQFLGLFEYMHLFIWSLYLFNYEAANNKYYNSKNVLSHKL